MTARTLAELAALVGGEVSGDGSIPITGVAPLEEAGPGQLSFFANKKYRAAFEASKAGAVLVGTEAAVPAGRTVVRSLERLPGLRQGLDPLQPAAGRGARDLAAGRRRSGGAGRRHGAGRALRLGRVPGR